MATIGPYGLVIIGRPDHGSIVPLGERPMVRFLLSHHLVPTEKLSISNTLVGRDVTFGLTFVSTR